MTQKSYFGGHYVGCDASTGLMLPDWAKFFSAYGISALALDPLNPFCVEVTHQLNSPGPAVFLVPIDPEQTYFPKITSKVLMNGQMESNPLHLMTPDLTDEIQLIVFKYLEM
jgi:acetolactate synthase-1/2/3 large subunit